MSGEEAGEAIEEGDHGPDARVSVDSVRMAIVPCDNLEKQFGGFRGHRPDLVGLERDHVLGSEDPGVDEVVPGEASERSDVDGRHGVVEQVLRGCEELTLSVQSKGQRTCI